MTDGPFDPIEALRVLVRHGVRFVVIGGFAAGLHGAPIPTFDLDICYARDPENLERLAEALRELGAYLRGAPAGLPFKLDSRTLRAGDHFTFTTTFGSLDCLGTPSGIGSFDDLDSGATDLDLGDLPLRIAGVDDLISMKKAAGRPKDRATLEWLGAVREEIDREEGEEPRRGRRGRGIGKE